MSDGGDSLLLLSLVAYHAPKFARANFRTIPPLSVVNGMDTTTASGGKLEMQLPDRNHRTKSSGVKINAKSY